MAPWKLLLSVLGFAIMSILCTGLQKLDIKAPKVGELEHQLQYAYSLWFMERETLPSQRLSSSSAVYEDNIKLVATFSSVSVYLMFCFVIIILPCWLLGRTILGSLYTLCPAW